MYDCTIIRRCDNRVDGLLDAELSTRWTPRGRGRYVYLGDLGSGVVDFVDCVLLVVEAEAVARFWSGENVWRGLGGGWTGVRP